MKTTDKRSVRELAALLPQYGVKHAVMSPGSRNAPLLVAFERHPLIETRIVIDERSAAFMALGMADRLSEPVALVCTSGTAPLNYAPAIAEAFYRNIPLIVITADRPSEWIDQDDSQTINQEGIFSNYIRGSFDIPVDSIDSDRMWYINRTLNDALSLAVSQNKGPVHINIRISEPLNKLIEVEENEDIRKIVANQPQISMLSHNEVDDLANEISKSNATLILAGFMPPMSNIEPLRVLAELPNVVVMHEAQSNLHHGTNFIPNIDATLRLLPESAPNPDLVITIGGSLTSRMIKTRLRNISGLRHWSIGKHPRAVDCFKHLTRRIMVEPERILSHLSERITKTSCELSLFKQTWLEASKKGLEASESFAQQALWSDFKAISFIIKSLPHDCDLQLSNGTAVRYAQLFNYSQIGRIDCNRGVSGIDGCTSTAIGAASVSNKTTVLISGDMSFQYDIGALAATLIPNNFKIIVLSNGGGGIFRFIQATRNFDELERCFVGPINLPLKQLASAYKFNYFSATTFDELTENFNRWLTANDHPSILEITTDGNVSAETIRKYFS